MAKQRPPQGVKHRVKDSVFTHLFKEPKYLLELYQSLHPEDQTVTKEDLEIVTIENILVDQWYNDLGFLVRGILIVLVECQSIWSLNIVMRLFLYLSQTYQEYITKNQLNIHSRKKVVLPKPELYVIYTGEHIKEIPEEISLAEEFFGGDKSVVEVKARVICDGEEGDIINQYSTFTKVLQEQIKRYGWTRDAIIETIHICKNKDVLKEFLMGREKEVVDIMTMLFDQEYAAQVWGHELKEQGRQEGNMETAYKFYKGGISVENISNLLNISIKDLKEWFNRIEKQEKEHLN